LLKLNNNSHIFHDYSLATSAPETIADRFARCIANSQPASAQHRFITSRLAKSAFDIASSADRTCDPVTSSGREGERPARHKGAAVQRHHDNHMDAAKSYNKPAGAEFLPKFDN